MITNTIAQLKKELDEITLIDLAKNKENIQKTLTELVITIQEFFKLINLKNRLLHINTEGEIRKRWKK